MPDVRRLIRGAWVRLWCQGIRVHGRAHLPLGGPVLYVSLHRNGIVDGFIQEVILPSTRYLLSVQWTRGFLGLFFDGIPVVREKDGGDRTQNTAALDLCVDHLLRGGELTIYPEGTSSLGPRHLPFKTGAARVLAAYLEQTESPITVLPLGLHYERAWAFRSRVELVIGPPVSTATEPGLTPKQRLRALQERLAQALEGVGVNLESPAEQALVEGLATVATLGTDLSYYGGLKAFEKGVPEDIRAEWMNLEQALTSGRGLRHQGVALMPAGSAAPYFLGAMLLAPGVLLGLLLNLPPFLAAVVAGKVLPDDRNVVALWRILIGMPALALWALAVGAGAWCQGKPLWFLAYVLVTALGIGGWYRLKKLGVTLHNALWCGALRDRMFRLQRRVIEFVSSTGPT